MLNPQVKINPVLKLGIRQAGDKPAVVQDQVIVSTRKLSQYHGFLKWCVHEFIISQFFPHICKACRIFLQSAKFVVCFHRPAVLPAESAV